MASWTPEYAENGKAQYDASNDELNEIDIAPRLPPKPEKWLPITDAQSLPLADPPMDGRISAQSENQYRQQSALRVRKQLEENDNYPYSSGDSPHQTGANSTGFYTRFISAVRSKARALREAIRSRQDAIFETFASSATDSVYYSQRHSAPPVKPPKPRSLTNQVADSIVSASSAGIIVDEERKTSSRLTPFSSQRMSQPVGVQSDNPMMSGYDVQSDNSMMHPEQAAMYGYGDQGQDPMMYGYDNQTGNPIMFAEESQTIGSNALINDEEVNAANMRALYNADAIPDSVGSSAGSSPRRMVKSLQDKAIKARNGALTRQEAARASQQVRALMEAVGDPQQSVDMGSPLQRIRESITRRTSRAESSFAIWQVNRARAKLRRGIFWDGDQKYPYFCYLIIFVTGIILFAEIANNKFQIENFSTNPTLGPTKDVLIAMGAKRTDLILKGEFHRLLASWFLHGGIIHWLINMFALRNLGFSMEREFGTPKIAIIYCWAGFAGQLTSCVFLPNLVGVGASGAIFGLFGASWSDLIQNYELYKTRKEEKRLLRQLVIGTLVNITLGLIPIIDQFAHMGGLFSGMFLGFFLLLQTRYTRYGVQKRFRRRNLYLRLFGLFVATLGVFIMLIALYQQVNPRGHWCEWCEHVNCAPIDALWFCDASGCSDDAAVHGAQYTNGTLDVTCPSFVNRTITVPMSTKATPLDVIKICRTQCFPP